MATVTINIHSDFEGDYDRLIKAIQDIADATEWMIGKNLGCPEERENTRIKLLHHYIRLGSELQQYASYDYNCPIHDDTTYEEIEELIQRGVVRFEPSVVR